MVLFGLIITVSPDLEHERRVLVTPAVKWIADTIMDYGWAVRAGVWIMVIGSVVGAAGGVYVTWELAESVDVEVDDPDGEDKSGDDAKS